MQQIEEWMWSALAQLWSFILVAYLVYQLGALSKAIAKKRGWKGTPENPSWFDLWQRIAPFPAGAVWGIVPFPTLHAISEIAEGDWSPPEVAARMGWFMLAGGFCGQVYELVNYGFTMAKKKLGITSQSRGSDPGGGAV